MIILYVNMLLINIIYTMGFLNGPKIGFMLSNMCFNSQAYNSKTILHAKTPFLLPTSGHCLQSPKFQH